jgi:hypothetical protein
MTKRREFIAGLGSAAAWPLVARAQQRERMRRIGVFMNLASDDPEAQARLAASTKDYRNWAGSWGEMYPSIIVGVALPRMAAANQHPNWWPLPRMYFLLLVQQLTS